MGGHFVRFVPQRLIPNVGVLGDSVNGLLCFLGYLCLGLLDYINI
jgi:hypothetical protein